MQAKVKKKWTFKKKPERIEKSFLFQDPMNPANTWKGKLEAASFFDI